MLLFWGSKVKGQGHRVSKCIFSHYCPVHNSKTNDPKVFKVGIGNDLGISYKCHGFRFKGQRSTLGLGLGLTAIRRGFELYVPYTLVCSLEFFAGKLF